MIALRQEDLWPLVETYMHEKGLARQHIDSFNELIRIGLQQIVNEVGEVPIEVAEKPYRIVFGKITVGRPRVKEADGSSSMVTPMEARLRNLTYAAPIYLEMGIAGEGYEGPPSYEPIHIGELPVLLKSDCCILSRMDHEELMAIGEDPSDPGGYFIVNGSERVIVALEDLAPDRILVDIERAGAKPVYRAKVFSTTVGLRARIELVMKSDGTMHVTIHGVPTSIPLVILMRALGLETDREIGEAISSDENIQRELEPSFRQTASVATVEDAILYIGNSVAYGQVREYRLKKAEAVLDNNLLPHLGLKPEARREKALYLGEMACRVVELKLGWRSPDDKDHYANKRLRFAGSLLAELFRTAFRSLCKDMKYQLERMSIKKPGIERVSVAVRPGIITERLRHALATGNWGRGKVGISQLLDRTNFMSALSHLRRVQSPLSRSQPNFEARDLHPTQWGRLCPTETPEGSNCGLVKNLALMATISVGTDVRAVEECLFRLGVVPRGRAGARLRGAKVFVDGRLVGYTSDPNGLTKLVREYRRSGELQMLGERLGYAFDATEVNIACRECYPPGEVRKEVIVNCDAGRVRRPLIVVEDGKPKLTSEHIEKVRRGEWSWDHLVKYGIIEFLDADEEEDAYIALRSEDVTSEHTHLEFPPSVILGVCATVIPYAEHNQSPRNSYEAAMAKQALGINAINILDRVDSRAHVLHYPQMPLVDTKPMRLIDYHERPAGQNCVVAVLSYGGYNMEDALIFNKSSVERGLGWSAFYRIYEAECRHYLAGLEDEFGIPDSLMRGYRGEQYYRLLDESDGIVQVEADVQGGDVLIGRISPPRFLGEYREVGVAGQAKRDTSISTKPSELGTVDAVFVTTTAQGTKLIKVRVRDLRIPELGDKFASRHGQKGVIGLLVPQEDLPFTEDGIVPDIIINPHAIPSRMTIGQFLESIAGKIAAVTGKVVDGTPFTNAKEGLRNLLLRLGFQHSGREVLYDGLTGRKYEADIFFGVAYYQKLHHMVVDKIHVRARGQVQMLTRQPTEGRTRGGGLRFGEMERDCLIGHGASTLLKDRLLEESDKYMMYVCERCGHAAYYDLRTKQYICRLCGDEAIISPIVVSYAFKLLLQELLSLCIAPKLKLREKA